MNVDVCIMCIGYVYIRVLCTCVYSGVKWSKEKRKGQSVQKCNFIHACMSVHIRSMYIWFVYMCVMYICVNSMHHLYMCIERGSEGWRMSV